MNRLAVFGTAVVGATIRGAAPIAKGRVCESTAHAEEDGDR